jgi:hypothetical protein
MATIAVGSAIEYDEHCGGEAEILIFRNSGEMDNSYKTAFYPNYSLPKTFQRETWKLLHGLAEAQMKGRANRDAPGLVDGFCQRIRKAETESRNIGSGDFSENSLE